MATLDSIKILAPLGTVGGFNPDLYRHQTESEFNRQTTDKSVLRGSNTVGLKSVTIDRMKDNIVLEMSAKVLLNDYSRGLTVDTVEMAIANINRSGDIKLTPDFIGQADVLRIDVTDNIRPQLTGSNFYKALASIPVAKKYHVDLFDTKTNLGLVFKGNQKSIRDRMIIYDKQTDLINDSKFRKSVNTHKVLNDFKGIARVESNHSQFKQFNKFYGTRNLIAILNSNYPLNHNIFDRITSRANDTELSLFGQFEGMKWNQIEKFIGRKGIIEMFNYDWSAIERFIRAYNRNNYRSYKTELMKTYRQMQESRGVNYSIIDDIKNQLKLVA